MATVRVAAPLKERMGAERFDTGQEVSVKATVGRPAKRRRRSSPRLSLPKKMPRRLCPRTYGGCFLAQTLSVTGRSVRDERGESYEGARGGNTGVRLERR